MLITFTNSLDPDQDRQECQIQTFDTLVVFQKDLKKINKVSRQQQKHEKLSRMQRVKRTQAAIQWVRILVAILVFPFKLYSILYVFKCVMPSLVVFVKVTKSTKNMCKFLVGKRKLVTWYSLKDSCGCLLKEKYMSRDMRFPTMWYVRPAKPQIRLCIHPVWSEPLLVAWIFCECSATEWTSFGVSKLKRRLHRLVGV